MIKRKNPPSKPGWYIAWFDGDSLNINDNNIQNEINIFYWTGKRWLDCYGYISNFGSDFEKYEGDRWSYLPKNHFMRGKAAPQI